LQINELPHSAARDRPARTLRAWHPVVPGARMNPSDPIDAAALAVLAYLDRHRHAADSVAGVARWWMGDDSRFTLVQVQQALDRLVAAGRVRREPLGDGTWLYAGATAPSRGGRALH
jgi:hypothetical protein